MNDAAKLSKLTAEQRTQVLAALCRSLKATEPDMMAEPARSRPGGAVQIEEHLDELIDIVRQTTTSLPEAYLFQILEDICAHCPYQYPRGHCDLRYRKLCVLYRNAPVIAQAIAAELVEMRDPEYLLRRQLVRAAKSP